MLPVPFRGVPERAQRSPEQRAGIHARFLLPGPGVDHGQDARTERFRQRRPGVENALQLGVGVEVIPGAAPGAVVGKGLVGRCGGIGACGIIQRISNPRS